jgi:uncharacterized membrane protein
MRAGLIPALDCSRFGTKFTMNVKCLFKYFAIACGVQIGLLVLSGFVPHLGHFLFFNLYEWVTEIVDQLTGAKGESTMIVTPVIGILAGMVLYSLVASIVVCYFKGRRADSNPA